MTVHSMAWCKPTYWSIFACVHERQTKKMEKKEKKERGTYRKQRKFWYRSKYADTKRERNMMINSLMNIEMILGETQRRRRRERSTLTPVPSLTLSLRIKSFQFQRPAKLWPLTAYLCSCCFCFFSFRSIFSYERFQCFRSIDFPDMLWIVDNFILRRIF